MTATFNFELLELFHKEPRATSTLWWENPWYKSFFLQSIFLQFYQDVCLKTSKNYTDYCSFTKHLHAMDQEVCLVTFKNYTDLWFHIAMEEGSLAIEEVSPHFRCRELNL